MRSSLLVCLLAPVVWPQTPQEAAVMRQRESVEKQRMKLEAQAGPLAQQAASVKKQKSSASKQPALLWPPPVLPLPAGTTCAPLSPARIEPLLEKAARENSLTPDLLRSVIQKESAFQPCAVSRAGAMGLMQLMPGTASDLRVDDPFDPEENVSAGSRFLRLLIDRFDGDLGLALGAYNAGPARVESSGGIPPIAETRAYVSDILRTLR